MLARKEEEKFTPWLQGRDWKKWERSEESHMKGIQIQGAYLCSKKVTDFEKRKYFSSTSSTKSGEQPLLECPLTTQGGFEGV